MLHERCRAYLSEQTKENNETNGETSGGKGKKRLRGPSFKLGGVSVNAKTMMACEEELAPLDEVLPSDAHERSRWVLEARTKPAHFDVDWDSVEDSKLLQGIYIYGMGSWEQIKLDPSLGIGDKILLNEDKKPQAKQLQSRSEYLLKILRKQLDQKKGVSKPKRQRKVKETKALTKEIIENDDISSNDESTSQSTLQSVATSSSKKPAKTPKRENKEQREDHKDKDEDTSLAKHDKKAKKREKKEKKKRAAGPMHFTANNEPRALDVLGDLDPAVFNECKEKMRPVKKALKALDNPDQSLPENEQVANTTACLIQIGEQINTCLEAYTSESEKKAWKSWVTWRVFCSGIII